MKKARNIIGDVCFFAAVIGLLCLVLAVAKGKAPSLFGYRVLRVISSSMEPVISEETCIIIKEVEPDTLKEGDIITFISTDPSIYGYYNTHRIYDSYLDAEGKMHFITKGDANEYPDDYEVTEDKVIGAYVRELPFGELLGKALSKLSNRNVYFLVVILPLLICLISYVIQFLNALFDKQKDEED